MRGIRVDATHILAVVNGQRVLVFAPIPKPAAVTSC